MDLSAYCKYCETVNAIPSKGIVTKRDLEEKHGEKISFECKSCASQNEVHVNLVSASGSIVPLLICTGAGLLFIGITILHFNFFSFGIAGVLFTAGFISSNSVNATAFNKSKI